MDTLPLLDEHSTTIPAPRAAVWQAAQRYAQGLSRADHWVFARVLGTDPPSGFRLEDSTSEQQLALSGRHRFSRYRLVFVVADQAAEADETAPQDRTTTLAVRSYAEFPGLHGRVYRALLLGSRGHVLAVEGMLRSIRGQAVRGDVQT